MKRINHYVSYFAVAIVSSVLFISGCNDKNEATGDDLGTIPEKRSNIQLKTAESRSEFENDVKAYFTRMLEEGQAPEGTARAQEDGSILEMQTDSAAPAGAEAVASINVSDTNLIEAGVDEADLVKSDGQYLFVAQQAVFNSDAGIEPADTSSLSPDTPIPPVNPLKPANIRVMLLDNQSPDTKEVAKIELPQTVSSIVGLYLSNFTETGKTNQLIAVTRTNAKNSDELFQYFRSDNTLVIAYDVSNPENPEKQWDIEIEGYHNASRSMNGKLYLVSSKSLWMPALDVHSKELSVIEENKILIDNLTAEDILPMTWVNGIKTNIVQANNCMVPKEKSKESVFAANLLVVYTIPVIEPEKTQSFCTLESSAEIYASTNAIYFTRGEYILADDVNTPGKNYTIIHKLNYSEDNVVYQSSARIPGWTGWRNKSFRMSELNGDLRIVLTENEVTGIDSPQESESVSRPSTDGTDDAIASTSRPFFSFEQRPVHRLYVLRENENDEKVLSVLSQLPNKTHPEKIGKPGEDIYAVRFFGDYAYIVTFRRTDPLYAINLKDPAAPFIEGELSIPGFSDYLHPINDNLLLGVGQDATEDGRIQGIKIALFDVSDKSKPVTLNNIVIGYQGSNTALSYDYRAFAILSDAETGKHKIALPISVYDTENMNSNHFTNYQWTYNGLQLLEVDDGSISTIASMTDSGVIKAVKASNESRWHNAQNPRSVIANDAIHYVDKAKIWSALWDVPEVVNGPN
ncbi:MAG: hypothetical protein GXP14_15540 [Gammaproteobacteria bacterium]|nr:hypothetical protein [Gammaproteobacteria bacterium]